MQSKNNFIKGLSLIIFILIVAISCDNRPTGQNPLFGTWQNPTYSGETYIISSDRFDGGSYKMDVEKIIWSSDYSGIIYGKYTENSYLSDVIGKYYAVSFKNLTYTKISISGAYKSGGKNGADTLEEAITEFTIENSYFGTYSDCERTK